MSLNLLFEGERRLVGALGANVALGGVKSAHHFMTAETHLFTNILTVVQILVAVATLTYMLLKVRKILKKKNE
jgi:hypothetical protein